MLREEKKRRSTNTVNFSRKSKYDSLKFNWNDGNTLFYYETVSDVTKEFISIIKNDYDFYCKEAGVPRLDFRIEFVQNSWSDPGYAEIYVRDPIKGYNLSKDFIKSIENPGLVNFHPDFGVEPSDREGWADAIEKASKKQSEFPWRICQVIYIEEYMSRNYHPFAAAWKIIELLSYYLFGYLPGMGLYGDDLIRRCNYTLIEPGDLFKYLNGVRKSDDISKVKFNNYFKKYFYDPGILDEVNKMGYKDTDLTTDQKLRGENWLKIVYDELYKFKPESYISYLK